MCGIAGLLLNDAAAKPDPRRLRAMVDALTHRGPDDDGFFADGNVAIGMRRLAIVDPAGGHQPIANEDGSVHVVYNGECYNFRELRAELVAADHRFATNTDTEVLVHGYETWGARGLLERLNGIFAFCLWDARRRVAYIGRDRLGVKPLYYLERATGLAFASELRALVPSGLCLAKLDDQTVWRYLLYQFAPTDRTLLAGVMKLPPAHMLEWRAGQPSRLERYWNLSADAPNSDVSFDEATARVRALLEDSVRRQLVGDVPMGCFLSGGLDSSVVAALMARETTEPLRTYSIGFPTSVAYDEMPAALTVARAIGARHTTVAFTEHDVLDRLDEYLSRVDEPIGDAAMLPTYLLAEAAARDVKVVLTGEGADEIFAGYSYYAQFASDAGSAPPLRRSAGVPAVGLPSAFSGFPYVFSLETIWCLLDLDRRPSFETFKQVLTDVETSAIKPFAGATPLQRATGVDLATWLAHDVLVKLDKATMAHGLEGRVPMLDHRLVELACGFPDAFRFGGGLGKHVLRRAAHDLVPASILSRPKQGFGVPLDSWFTGPLEERGLSLRDSALVSDGVLTRDGVEQLVTAHRSGRGFFGRALWTLLTLDAWWDRIRAEIAAAAPVTERARSLRTHEPSVDIVIPVAGALNLVRDCVHALRMWTTRPFRAMVVHDGGDDAAHDRLRALIGADDRFVLMRNDRPLGYVASCTRAMSASDADYIVLLNSDTVVTPGWLDRLVTCAESDPLIAIVNPLTNESGNTSVRFAPGLNVLTMARRVAQRSRRTYPDVTTAVGMCMLIRRSALELLGGFDPAYTDAYCEESDLCMRFTDAGFRAVVGDDAFVYHKGLGSYTEERKQQLYERNRALFDERWAVSYERDWSAYSRADPLQYMRDALLAGTTTIGETSTAQALDRHGHQLDVRRACTAIADGQRARIAPLVLADRAPADVREPLLEASVARYRQPPARFEGRPQVFPTRHYVSALPKADPGTLRITFLVSSLPLCGGILSIVQLARQFLAAGHDVKIATEERFFDPESLNLWAQPLVYRDRQHLIDAFPPSDVVIATFWVTARDYLPALRQRSRFASVYYIQDYEVWFYDEAQYDIRRDVIRTYAAAEHLIVKSRWLKDKIEQDGGSCTVVPLGVDLDVFYPRPRRRSERPRVIAPAIVDPAARRRGFPETVEIFKRIHAARPDVELMLIGQPESGMPPLPFPYTNVGRLFDPNRVAEAFSSADVLLDASQWQGFGRPGLEAMACGTVPALTNVGGISEYARHGENCVTIRPRDVEAAAGTVVRLLSDPPLLAKLRAAGPVTAAAYSHEIESARHLTLYQEWAARAHRV